MILIVIFALQCLLSGLEGFVKPEKVNDAEWEEVLPYLLPEDHPAYSKLEKLFSKARWTQSLTTIKLGKFSFTKHKKWENVVVARHSKIPGYILKIYTDDQIGLNARGLLVQRVKGANFIREVIDRNNLGDQFDVPQKWLYLLPETNGSANLDPKYFILVAEDMHIVDSELNFEFWKSSNVTEDLLLALFTILNQGGLLDSIYIDNIPLNWEGKIVFIDTEHYQRWPIKFDYLTKRFSKSNQKYWKTLF